METDNWKDLSERLRDFSLEPPASIKIAVNEQIAKKSNKTNGFWLNGLYFTIFGLLISGILIAFINAGNASTGDKKTNFISSNSISNSNSKLSNSGIINENRNSVEPEKSSIQNESNKLVNEKRNEENGSENSEVKLLIKSTNQFATQKKVENKKVINSHKVSSNFINGKSEKNITGTGAISQNEKPLKTKTSKSKIELTVSESISIDSNKLNNNNPKSSKQASENNVISDLNSPPASFSSSTSKVKVDESAENYISIDGIEKKTVHQILEANTEIESLNKETLQSGNSLNGLEPNGLFDEKTQKISKNEISLFGGPLFSTNSKTTRIPEINLNASTGLQLTLNYSRNLKPRIKLNTGVTLQNYKSTLTHFISAKDTTLLVTSIETNFNPVTLTYDTTYVTSLVNSTIPAHQNRNVAGFTRIGINTGLTYTAIKRATWSYNIRFGHLLYFTRQKSLRHEVTSFNLALQKWSGAFYLDNYVSKSFGAFDLQLGLNSNYDYMSFSAWNDISKKQFNLSPYLGVALHF